MASGAYRRSIARLCDDEGLDIEVICRDGIRVGPPETDVIFERIICRVRRMRTRTEPANAVLVQLRKLANSTDLWLPPDDGGASTVMPEKQEAA